MRSFGLLPFAVLSQTNDARMVLGQVAQAQIQSNIAAASSVLAGLVLDNKALYLPIVKKCMRSRINNG